MNKDKPSADPRERASGIAELTRNARLIWRLLKDPRVPLWTKAIPFLGLAYVIWPLDLAPDALFGLGQLDDLTVILLSLKAFIGLSPGTIVDQYRIKLRREDEDGAQDTVDASYRVIDDRREED